MPRPFPDDETNPVRQAINDLSDRIDALEGPGNAPEPSEPAYVPERAPRSLVEGQSSLSWSQKQREPRDWEPMPGKPGWFTDPHGIMQSVARGEVPREVLERFGEKPNNEKEES